MAHTEFLDGSLQFPWASSASSYSYRRNKISDEREPNYVTDSKELSHSWEVGSRSATQELSNIA
jgi:hypothetical protein